MGLEVATNNLAEGFTSVAIARCLGTWPRTALLRGADTRRAFGDRTDVSLEAESCTSATVKAENAGAADPPAVQRAAWPGEGNIVAGDRGEWDKTFGRLGGSPPATCAPSTAMPR